MMDTADTRLPSITVITATHGDDPQRLRQAIDSVRRQTYPPIQHILAATDTPDPAFKALIGDLGNGYEALQYLPIPPRGVYDAINHALNASEGDIIGLVHGNDRLTTPEVLQEVATLLADHPDADYLYGDVEFISSRSGRVVRRYRPGVFREEWLCHGYHPPHPSLYIRRRVLEVVGPYSLQYPVGADFDYFIRLQEADMRGIYLPMTMVTMTTGGLSTSLKRLLLGNTREKCRILRSHGIPTTWVGLMRRYLHAINPSPR